MISFNKETFLKIYRFLCNPITAIGFSIALSLFFLYLGKEEKRPSYYITKPELISKQSDDKIRIFYDNIEYPNLYSVNLIIWNEGDKLIDAQDLVNSNLPTLYSNDSLKFLSCETLRKSRSDLLFSVSKTENKISFNIENNEAMENSDGASFKILYTNYSDEEPIFHFNSRIKGTKNGFILKDLNNYRIKNELKPIVLLWILLFLLLSIRIIVLLIYKKTIIFKRSELIFICFYLIILSYKTYNYIYLTTNIDWLK